MEVSGWSIVPLLSQMILKGWKFATWNSSITDLALWIIRLAVWSSFPSRNWFQLNQMLKEIVMTNSKISSPTCSTNFKCHKRSMNLLKCTPFESNRILEVVHISRVFPHCQNRCPLFSASISQASHVGLSKTFQWQSDSFRPIKTTIGLT